MPVKKNVSTNLHLKHFRPTSSATAPSAMDANQTRIKIQGEDQLRTAAQDFSLPMSQSVPLDPHVTLQFDALFCTCDINCMSVPPLQFIMRYPSTFSPVKVFFFQYGKFFLTRMEDDAHHSDCKAHGGNVILILGYIKKTDMM